MADQGRTGNAVGQAPERAGLVLAALILVAGVANLNQLTKSFAGAEAVAEQYPQYASQITAAARQSFLNGDQWAYTAGIVAVLLGAVLVFFLFPKKDEEQQLLAAYQAEDAAQLARRTLTPA